VASKNAVLVVGGAGFIGSNLVRALAERGTRVVALDNEFLGKFTNLDGVDCVRVRADALDSVLLDRAVRKHQVTRVVHLAGYTSAPMYEQEPGLRIRENFEEWMNVLELGRRHSLKIAYASTSSFYARSEKPFREDTHLVPATPYELSKYIMEQAAHAYQLQYGVVANGLRFFSVYGPHEEHKGRYANNISQFYWSIANGVRPVVFGDGSQTRDFTYVGDLVEAILAILDKGRRSDVYNIGTGREHSFNEILDLLNAELGSDVEPRYVENPLRNYVQETLADTSKIEREIGWRSRTTVAEGIRRLVAAGTTYDTRRAEALYAWVPGLRTGLARARPTLRTRRVIKPRTS
jgi:UDP-glucose 4-epimerase